jgi:hypothetical protein
VRHGLLKTIAWFQGSREHRVNPRRADNKSAFMPKRAAAATEVH